MAYFLCKIDFHSGEVTKSGKPVTTKYEVLVNAESPFEVIHALNSHLKDMTTEDYEIRSIAKTKIESVL
jgi:hypothetical protein